MKNNNIIYQEHQEKMHSGFDSRTCYNETRPGGGFPAPENNPDQKVRPSTRFNNASIKHIVMTVLRENSDVSKPIPYKQATVYNGDKEWFVQFRYWSLQKEKYLREKVTINKRGLSKQQRGVLLQKLADGFNKEFEKQNSRYQYRKEEYANKTKNWDILKWIDAAQLQKNLADDRKKTYVSLKGNIELFYKEYPSFKSSKIYDIDEMFIELFTQYLRSKNITGKTINKYLWAIDKIQEFAYKKGEIINVHSTVDDRVPQPKNESGRYPPLSTSEKIICFNYFREKRPQYYLFLLHIYYTSIRPDELHRLQVKDINLKSRTIYVDWFDSKNGLSKYVQILEPLYSALMDFGIDKLDPEIYLFGDKFESSYNQYEGRALSTNTWANHRENMSIPKGKTAYGLKHTFNIDYVENNKYNIDWEWLRRHNRHATIQQTQEYISGLTAYFLDETKAVIINYHDVPGRGLIKKAAIIPRIE